MSNRSTTMMNVGNPGAGSTSAAQRETAGARAASRNTIVLGAADCLSLAATPTFAIMAVLTGPGPTGRLCSVVRDGLPLCGMVPMYLLMSAFHLAPWLRLTSRRRSSAHPS
jgi:hypothetical protein